MWRSWALILLVLAVAAIPAAARTMAVEPAAITAGPGAAVTVGLALDDAAGVAGWQCDVSFPPALLTYAGGATPEAGSLLAGLGWSISASLVEEGRLRVLAYSPTAAELPAGGGGLVQLSFTAADTPGSGPISLTGVVLANGPGSPITPVTTADGTVTITTPGGPPTAAFTWLPAEPTDLQTVQFTDTSTDDGAITAWEWDFGDGATSTEQHPTHQFTAHGTYTVTLTVTDNDGLTDDVSQSITVSNVPPTAAFTRDVESPAAGQTVQFTCTSTDPDGDIAGWQWDFGDGATSDVRDPQHAFAAGTYTVSLVVTDDDGATSEPASVELTVTEAGARQLWVGDTTGTRTQIVTTDITVDETEGIAGLALLLTYDETALGMPVVETGGAIPADWDFLADLTFPGRLYIVAASPTATPLPVGSGALIRVQLMELPTAAAGSTDLVLSGQLYDAAGAELPVTCHNGTNTLQNQPPVAAWTCEPASPRVGELVTFTCSSTDDQAITSRSWDFGDGETGDGPSPGHAYAAAGQYLVTLAVTDSDGETAYSSATLAVTDPALPQAAFTWSPSEPLTNEVVQLTDQSVAGDAPITGWAWDFGDGATDSSQHPTHQYADHGAFTVTLTVTDELGHSDSVQHDLTVANRPPLAAIDCSATTAAVGQVVTFTDCSTDADGLVAACHWDFGDGVTAEGSVVTHAFAAEGDYTVALLVTDDDGAAASCAVTVQVRRRETGLAVAMLVPNRRQVGHWGEIKVWLANSGSEPLEVTVTLQRTEPGPAQQVGAATVTVPVGGVEKVAFDYLFRPEDEPQATFRVTAAVAGAEPLTAEGATEVFRPAGKEPTPRGGK